MGTATIKRKTAETDIALTLDTSGGARRVKTGCGFLDHMLDLFAFHSGFGLDVECAGDTWVDYHHTVEDVGIALGEALRECVKGGGIARYGSVILPMDEALVLVAVDISGRPFLGWAASIPTQKVGDFDTELVEEFMLALTRSLGCALHIRQLAGTNSHHIIEAMFKGLGRAMRQAAAPVSESFT